MRYIPAEDTARGRWRRDFLKFKVFCCASWETSKEKGLDKNESLTSIFMDVEGLEWETVRRQASH